MDQQEKLKFVSHIEKVARMPPRRHLRFGLPVYVENVTKQARLIYRIESDKLHILRCFQTHKEYEKWYNSFR